MNDMEFTQKAVERAVMARQMAEIAESWAVHGSVDERDVMTLERLGRETAISPLMLLRHYQEVYSAREYKERPGNSLEETWTSEEQHEELNLDNPVCHICRAAAQPMEPNDPNSPPTITHATDCSWWNERLRQQQESA